MILERRHPQSQKSCKNAEIFVFVMVGLPHQGKSCERDAGKAGCAFAYIPGELTKPRRAHQKSRAPNEPPPVGRSSKMKPGLKFFGAGDGTRTRACELGKLVPYHLATPAQDLMLAQHQQ